mmetsp:Transcript_93572/g.195074  ORF Transcript_93572/g.195074 Transcript_93572/m.195074 type:complete len:399 (+) Transcript_93572:341-1537(+)|eukprot:CAMPEP_0206420850 /NCGR_PEP_ID=MMETSP0324_2-20121206/1110_1 /ASSEMBLY_ACC=CAM_ASM_000836 /TAXON_ID=2866 /ORGANISM="Crypthecodinium cohnii, Strain Seligo" /LENGTH=398 /DNA_ID=CAMNT_0053884857 /DNA_START=300 /DNA_END=1496 /DNA_ORIENTATION=-
MAEDESPVIGLLGWVAVILLFLLIMGLAGTVDIATLKAQFHRRMGILCGLVCQFFMMPLVGFTVVSIANPSRHIGLTILILCSSSGGAYSNWWCSLFNADLALSVAMTAVSTFASAIMLPLNLTFYVNMLTTEEAEDVSIPWRALLQGVATVALAIVVGIGMSTKFPQHMQLMGKIGNTAGVCMILLTLITSMVGKKQADDEPKPTPLWAHPGHFYLTVASPFVASLILSLVVSSLPCLQLSKPERVAITVEVCYQNIGIASAVALAAYNDEPSKRIDAAAVPVIYGFVEAVSLAIFCLIAWKVGWTYAPADENLRTIIRGDYQPKARSATVLDESPESPQVIGKIPMERPESNQREGTGSTTATGHTPILEIEKVDKPQAATMEVTAHSSEDDIHNV